MREKLESVRLFFRSVAKIEWLACVLFVGLGWVLRTRGVLWGGVFGMWNDEASWSMRLLERSLSQHTIRPPLFMGLTRLGVAILGKSEFGFRLLPWLAGMASPVLAIYLGRRMLQNAAARVFFVGVVSLAEGSIDFSKEFKPYSVGIFLHLLLPFLVLRWVQSRTRKDLLWACAALPLGILFCQDVLFLYPGLFLLMAVEAYRTRSLKELYLVVGFGALTVAFVAGMYFGFWKRIEKDRAENYWGKRYGVFHRPKNAEDTYAGWATQKYLGVVDLPNRRASHWSDETVKGRAFYEVREINSMVWVGLHLAGVAAIFTRRRWKEGLCFWSPMLVCMLFNLLGFWPFGPFRTNQFLLAETSVLAVLGLDWPSPNTSRLRMLTPAFLLLLLPLIFFERDWAATKRAAPATKMLSLLRQLNAWQQEAPSAAKEKIYLDHHSCQPFSYYIKYHPRGVRLWKELSKHIDYQCSERVSASLPAIRRLPAGSRVWLMSIKPLTGKRWPSDLKLEKRVKLAIHEMVEARVL